MRAVALRAGLYVVAAIAIVSASVFVAIALAVYALVAFVTLPMGFVAGAANEVGVMLAWQVIRRDGPWVYSANRRTGRRKAQYRGRGWQPPCRHWLRPGDILIDAAGKRTVQ